MGVVIFIMYQLIYKVPICDCQCHLCFDPFLRKVPSINEQLCIHYVVKYVFNFLIVTDLLSPDQEVASINKM